MTMPIKAQLNDLAARLAFAEYSRSRRSRLLADRYCINGKSHGKVANGVRCPWCKAVHRKGLVKVLADPNAPAQPPGYSMRMRPAQMPVASAEETW